MKYQPAPMPWRLSQPDSTWPNLVSADDDVVAWDMDIGDANLAVAAVNALHAAAPGREMATAEALPALMDAARGLCAWAYSIVNPAGLPQDYHTLREILGQVGRWDG